MKANDQKILEMLKKGGVEIAKAEAPLREALNKAIEAAELHEKAVKGEREELAYGELHCDDAMNKGCMTMDTFHGMPAMKIPMRTFDAKLGNAILSDLRSRMLTEEDTGIPQGERGHSIKEWYEDTRKVMKHYHASIMELKNDADKARLVALEKADAYHALLTDRENLISILSDEAIAEIETALKLKKIQEANPVLAEGIGAPEIPLEPYEIPEDLKDLYAKVVGIPKACDCPYDDYDEYDDCDCCDDWED